MTTYLLGDSPPRPRRCRRSIRRTSAAAANGAGRISYVALCAGCHGLEGNGVPNTVVAMRNNSTLRLADPRNLIVAMLDGIGAENFPHRQSMQAMPGFSDKLSDERGGRARELSARHLGRPEGRRDAGRRASPALTISMSKAEEAIERKKITEPHEQAPLTAHKIRELAPPFPRFHRV